MCTCYLSKYWKDMVVISLMRCLIVSLYYDTVRQNILADVDTQVEENATSCFSRYYKVYKVFSSITFVLRSGTGFNNFTIICRWLHICLYLNKTTLKLSRKIINLYCAWGRRGRGRWEILGEAGEGDRVIKLYRMYMYYSKPVIFITFRHFRRVLFTILQKRGIYESK